MNHKLRSQVCKILLYNFIPVKMQETSTICLYFRSLTGSGHVCTQEGFAGDKERCEKFYRCVDNGKGGYTRYDFECAKGTVWDDDAQTCNFASAVANPTCGSGGSGGQGSSTNNQGLNLSE